MNLALFLLPLLGLVLRHAAASAMDAELAELCDGVAEGESDPELVELCLTGAAMENRLQKRKNEFLRFGKRTALVRIAEEEEAGIPTKRKNEFVRFGKRKNEFVRFGKRKNEFVRFGKRKNEFVRFGKRKNEFVRFGRSVPEAPEKKYGNKF